MNFEKAHKELLKGKKIRRKEWEPLMHMSLVNNELKTFKGEYTNFYDKANVLITSDWIVIDGDGSYINFVQVIEELKNKKHITCKKWVEEKSDTFIFLDSDRIALCRSIEFDFMPTWMCLTSSDWELMK
jgi:hypothetical protein